MKKPTPPTPQKSNRQIVGLSLPPEIAAELKIETARRGLTIRSLFLEMWSQYQKKNK